MEIPFRPTNLPKCDVIARLSSLVGKLERDNNRLLEQCFSIADDGLAAGPIRTKDTQSLFDPTVSDQKENARTRAEISADFRNNIDANDKRIAGLVRQMGEHALLHKLNGGVCPGDAPQ